MPPTVKKPEVDPSVEPAVLDQTDPEGILVVGFQGEKYEFKRKRLTAVQFRRRMQMGRDIDGVEWLLGAEQFERFLTSTADEDGCTTIETWGAFFDAMEEATGAGNS